MKIPLLFLGIMLSLGTSASAATLELSDAWSRPALSMAVGYLTITNHDSKPEAIDQAKSPIAASVTLHQSQRIPMDSKMPGMQGMTGMGAMPTMTMVSVDKITIPADAVVKLAPGGYHLMLTGLHHPLKTGASFALLVHTMHHGWLRVIAHVR